MEYKPVRIIRLLEIHNTDEKVLRQKFPHATIERSKRTFKAYFKPGTVIDNPSVNERALFNAMKSCFAEIPQIPKVGGDDPLSGLARSHKSAKKGEMKFKREINSRVPETENPEKGEQ